MQRPVGPDSDRWDQSTTNLAFFKRWDSGKKVRKTSQVSAQRARALIGCAGTSAPPLAPWVGAGLSTTPCSLSEGEEYRSVKQYTSAFSPLPTSRPSSQPSSHPNYPTLKPALRLLPSLSLPSGLPLSHPLKPTPSSTHVS